MSESRSTVVDYDGDGRTMGGGGLASRLRALPALAARRALTVCFNQPVGRLAGRPLPVPLTTGQPTTITDAYYGSLRLCDVCQPSARSIGLALLLALRSSVDAAL
uniref:Uncharacterized protein n=1 Tax=Plectus sambesii TaxID=2011161 RepID=A0A914XQD6_9BILA